MLLASEPLTGKITQMSIEPLPDFTNKQFAEPVTKLAPKRVNSASSYLVTLAAIALGVEIRFRRKPVDTAESSIFRRSYQFPEFFEARYAGRQSYLWSGASPLTTDRVGSIMATSKMRTKPVLHKAGVRVAFGGAVSTTNFSTFGQLEAAGVREVCLKPHLGSLSKGVIGPISLAQAKAYILRKPGAIYIAEQFITGNEYRVIVVDDKVVKIVQRLPVHVVGDGQSTILELVRQKIKLQKKNPAAASKLYDISKIKEHLQSLKLSGREVPGSGKFVRLESSRIWKRGDSFNVPLGALPQLEKTSRDAVRSLGLKYGGLDLVAPRNEPPFVLEVNAKPGLPTSCFPFDGGWNLDVPEAIMRLHFPELGTDVREIARYDFLRLFKDFQEKPEVDCFDAADYVSFA